VGVFRAGTDWSWQLLLPPPPSAPAPEIGPAAPSPAFPVLAEALALSPRGDLFAGTPSGLYRWTDERRAWELLLGGSRIVAVVSAGGESTPVLLAGSAADGVLVSGDDGRSWSAANPGLEEPAVVGLAASPTFAVDRTAFAATTAGLYRTRSRQIVWHRLDLPAGETAVECLAISSRFADDGTVYVGTADGLFRSHDGGASWAVVPETAGEPTTAIAVDSHRGLIATAAEDGVWLSLDAGCTWDGPVAAPSPVLSLAFARSGDREALLAGCARTGLWRLDIALPPDQPWAPCSATLAGVLATDLALLPLPQGGEILVTTNVEDGVLRSRDGGRTWHPPAASAGVPAFALASSPPRAGSGVPRVYAALARGAEWSDDGGADWRALDVPDAEVVRALAVAEGSDGRDAVLVAAADGRWWLSDDGGRTWRDGRLDAGSTPVAACLAPDYARGPLALVTTAAQPGDPASPGSRLWASVDGGRSWRPWLELAGVDAIVPLAPPGFSRHRTLLAGAGPALLRARARPEEPRLRWEALTVPGGGRVSRLMAFPEYPRARRLLVGTDSSVCQLDERSGTIAPWGDGLAGLPIVGFAVAPADRRSPRFAYALDLASGVWRRRID